LKKKCDDYDSIVKDRDYWKMTVDEHADTSMTTDRMLLKGLHNVVIAVDQHDDSVGAMSASPVEMK
jgi:hypothetical protein